ncbi:MAG: AAA family ATPase [Burkholderiales bacterium]|nr:AAA family ATPase [Burkholderiales bacterium]
MKLTRLHLLAFGPFTNKVLNLGEKEQSLVIVHGPNEAGKSAMLRAITDLRYGIQLHSKDNFVHRNQDLRIGGEFLDQNGNRYSMLRTKSRKDSLTYTDFTDDAALPGAAVPPSIENLVTGGLRKEEYEKMFGLDHTRLREGGIELVKGEGQIGAALFEASAGIRSIRSILENLEGAARKFHVPGARGKSGRINEALILLGNHQSEYKKSLFKPAQWADLSKKRTEATEKLTELEKRQQELNKSLSLARELRAVAPILRRLDHALNDLRDLEDSPLLSETAATERADAEAKCASAAKSAELAASNAQRLRDGLASMNRDLLAIDAGSAIERLGASAESIDAHLRDRDDANAEVNLEQNRVDALAAKIDASRDSEALLKLAPSGSAKADLEEKIKAAETANLSLQHHNETLAKQDTDSEGSALPALPNEEYRIALRSALDEVTLSDAKLKRLEKLPSEIKGNERKLLADLSALSLSDATALCAVKPLLDAEIDEAIQFLNSLATRKEGLEVRIEALDTAIKEETKLHDNVLSAGDVPTAEDIAAARAHRDAGWALIRDTYIRVVPGTEESIKAFAGNTPLPEAYQQAVVRSDVLADEFAKDVERAERLQSCLAKIKDCERDRDGLLQSIADIEKEKAAYEEKWGSKLHAANLPLLEPTALREWQSRHSAVRVDYDVLQDKHTEFEDAQATEKTLTSSLRKAISNTGMGSPSLESSLNTLKSLATQINTDLKNREASLAKAAGERQEREKQALRMAAHEKTLNEQLAASCEALKPALTALLLSQSASATVARARLNEFDALVAANTALLQAQEKERKARDILQRLNQQAETIASVLGEEKKDRDLRLYIDSLKKRLQTARDVEKIYEADLQSQRQAEESQRTYQEEAQKFTEKLEALCNAAQVESIDKLPYAEEESRRKRNAQQEVDRSNSELAEASRYSIEELRDLLKDKDSATLDSEEASADQELSSLVEKLADARKTEEQARLALDAVDSSGLALFHREAMARATAAIESSMTPWMRSRLAHALLSEALKQFRERAQGPMLASATRHFEGMTGGEFVRLVSDDLGDRPVLLAERANDDKFIGVEAMSEGTRDQLYLALRLAALEIQRTKGVDLPTILDDVLMTSDDRRAILILQALTEFSKGSQVMVFTHHQHLVDLARKNLPSESLAVVSLQ